MKDGDKYTDLLQRFLEKDRQLEIKNAQNIDFISQIKDLTDQVKILTDKVTYLTTKLSCVVDENRQYLPQNLVNSYPILFIIRI